MIYYDYAVHQHTIPPGEYSLSRIISVHSFRGGTGKSNTTANVAAILAGQSLRVGVIDTDIQSPGIHVLFNLNDDDVRHSLTTISGVNARSKMRPTM